eukprot:scaffold111108_cov32-Tisochrysis_lutea.AAC.2
MEEGPAPPNTAHALFKLRGELGKLSICSLDCLRVITSLASGGGKTGLHKFEVAPQVCVGDYGLTCSYHGSSLKLDADRASTFDDQGLDVCP